MGATLPRSHTVVVLVICVLIVGSAVVVTPARGVDRRAEAVPSMNSMDGDDILAHTSGVVPSVGPTEGGDAAAAALVTFCNFSGRDVTQENLALTSFEVSTPGDGASEGDIVTVTFTLENVGQMSKYFSQENGVFVEASTPDGDATFGHAYRGTTLDPGESVTVSVEVTVTAGSWTVWPAYETGQGQRSPSPWHPCQFDVEEEAPPTPTPVQASCTLAGIGETGGVSFLSTAVGQPVTIDASGSTGGSDAAFDVDGNGRTDAIVDLPLVTGVTYDEPGTYQPTVRVRPADSNAESDEADCGTVSVHHPVSPTARLEVPPFVRAGEPVELDASASSDPDGDLVTYQWDLDRDGIVDRTTADPVATVTFEEYGRPYVTLRVVDDDGLVDSTGVRLVVLPELRLHARLRAFPAVPAPGESVRFTVAHDRLLEGSTATYRWDFDGDGTVDETTDGPSTTHTYDVPGSNLVAVDIDVTDADGDTATALATERVYVDVALDTMITPTKRQNVTGFHRPTVDGVFYGHQGQAIPDGRAGEWSDGHVGPVTLRSATGATAQGTVYLKRVGDELYLGLDVTDETTPFDTAGAISPSSIDRVTLQLDRDDDGIVTDGDVQIEWKLDDGNAGRVGTLGSVWTFEDGRYVPVEPGTVGPAGRGLLVPHPRNDTGGFEIRVDEGSLPDTVGDQDPSDGLTNVSLSVTVITEEDRFGLVRSPVTYAENYGIAVSAETTIAGSKAEVVPTDDISIFDVAYTQSVQRTDNSLPMVQNKPTLVRVYTEHDDPEPIETVVTLEAHRVIIDSVEDAFNPLDAGTEYLGSESTTFDAPPVAFRTDLADSATVTLPDSWTDVPFLRLEVTAGRPGYADETPEDNHETVLIYFRDVYEPTIAVVPVRNSSKTPQTPPGWWIGSIKDGFRRVMPVGDVRFRDYGPAILGDQADAGDNKLIRNLKDAHAYTSMTTPGPVDQTFGVTLRGGGLSDPVWIGGQSNVAWGSLSSSSGSFIMVHEVQHNIGNGSYGRHVGNNTDGIGVNGCGADGPDKKWRRQYDNDDVHEWGWDVATGVVPPDHPDVMSYCTADEGPRKWISDYRWVRLVDRFDNYVPGDPVDPNSQVAEMRSLFGDRAAGDRGASDAPSTVRVVSGTLYANGTASLSPSFTAEGYVADALPAVQEPAALLAVEYDNQTVHIPLAASFRTANGENREAYPFVIPVPNGDSVRSLRLVHPDRGHVMDAISPSNFTLHGASVETPERFERGQPGTLDVSVDATADRPLSYRLFYSPDGERWYPYGGAFTDADSDPIASFADLPGGEAARFRLQVSDGLRTETVETEPFVLPHAPPDVRLRLGDTSFIEYPAGGSDAGSASFDTALGVAGAGDRAAPAPVGVTDVSRPVHVTVGAVVSLAVDGSDERGDELPGSAYTWEVTGPDGSNRPLDGGERMTTRFDSPGRYNVSVMATDPATGLSASDDLAVVVGAPALPPADTVESFVEDRGETGDRLPGDVQPADSLLRGLLPLLAGLGVVLAVAAGAYVVWKRRD